MLAPEILLTGDLLRPEFKLDLRWLEKEKPGNSEMRVIFSLLLILGGICGMIVSFVSDITIVSSSVSSLDGFNLSMIGAGISIVLLINGVYDLFSTSS
jgi:hypothetical protein